MSDRYFEQNNRHFERSEESKCHSEASDLPCGKVVYVQNLANLKSNHNTGKILNQVQDDTASKTIDPSVTALPQDDENTRYSKALTEKSTTIRHSERSEESKCHSEASDLPCGKVVYVQNDTASKTKDSSGFTLRITKTFAASIVLTLCLCTPAFAQPPVPTLDTLKGQPVPDTDPQKYYPESAYEYKEIQNADPDNLPPNAVTIYEKQEVIKYYDPQTGKEVAESDRQPDVEYKEVKTYITFPKYYTVELKQKEYGHTDKYDSTKDIAVTAPNAGGSGNAFEYAVKYYVDSTRLHPDRITADQNGADINNDFIGNYASSSSAHGGAIYNYAYSSGAAAIIGDITGDFIGNYANSGNGADGGAIYNIAASYVAYSTVAEIGDITGDFIGNYANGGFSGYGGAIYNGAGSSDSASASAVIGNITGDFIGNYTRSGNYFGYGGAIYNRAGSSDSASASAVIGNITGDFVGNYAIGNSEVYGGAIYNDSSSKYSSGSDSAVAEIGNITGDFIGNYASGSSVFGGAIYNGSNSSSNITTHSDSAVAEIGNITGDFIGNYVSGSGYAYGGAIYNNAIYSSVTIGNITGDFIGNYVSGSAYAYGGAIYNDNAQIGNITGDFIGNYAAASSSPASNDAYGGAIYNTGTIGAGDEQDNITGGVINSNFINNYAQSSGEYAEALGGAIYTTSDLNIIAKDNGQSVFSGNYTEVNGTKTPNAIYVDSNISGVSQNPDIEFLSVNDDKVTIHAKNFNKNPGNLTSLTLNASTNGTILFDDQISGDTALIDKTYSANIAGMADSETFLNTFGITKEEVYGMLGLKDNATVSEFITAYIDMMESQGQEIPDNAEQMLLAEFITIGIVETSDPEMISDNSSGSYNLKITGDSTGRVILNNDVINANITLDNTNLYLGRENVFDQSQSLTLNSGSLYLNNNAVGTVHVPIFNLNGTTNISVDADLANKTMDKITADSYNIKDNAKLNVNNIILLSDAKEDKTSIQFADNPDYAQAVQYTGVSPIAYSPIYKYEVGYDPASGMFTFVRGGGAPSGSYENFNPAVVAPSVATQAGAYTTQVQTFNYAFQHADTFMNIPYIERLAIINQNKYALSPTADATDVGTFSPLLTKQEVPGFWIKPYASFENIPLKNGPKVSNINYGTLVGYDTAIQSIGHGWERVLTGYIGYNGASQRYSGVDTYQNGGLIGGTTTFYKGNFFNATTLSVGASSGSSTNMFGSEDYAMLLAGIGNKTGYNFEFFDGGIILQPSFLISYTFVNTFDYTNSAGLKIESDPLNAIQLAPGIKLIGNIKNGWQPYIGVNMVWNLLQDSKVTANDVRLPEMSIKPYVQYGAGIQRLFNDNFMAYGQAMIHNGGRNGISFSAGFRWKVGKE